MFSQTHLSVTYIYTCWFNTDEFKILKQIKNKLLENNATIVRADKGSQWLWFIVPNIMKRFITYNQFTKLNSDPTSQFQKQIRSYLNNNVLSFNNEHKSKLVNLNPMPPNIRGLIKLHKEGNSIRPVVNWRTAAYEVAKYLTRPLSSVIELPYMFNVTNTADNQNYFTNNEVTFKQTV